MFTHILLHELPNDLRRWPVLLAASFDELLTKLALDPNAKSRIFHGGQCTRWIHGLRGRIGCIPVYSERRIQGRSLVEGSGARKPLTASNPRRVGRRVSRGRAKSPLVMEGVGRSRNAPLTGGCWGPLPRRVGFRGAIAPDPPEGSDGCRESRNLPLVVNRRNDCWRWKAQCLICATGREGCNGRRAAGLPCQDGVVLQRTSCIRPLWQNLNALQRTLRTTRLCSECSNASSRFP